MDRVSAKVGGLFHTLPPFGREGAGVACAGAVCAAAGAAAAGGGAGVAAGAAGAV